MSLLSICTDIARGVGLLPPSTVIGNNNQDARRMLNAVQMTGKVLARKNWAMLVKEHTFATVSDVADYALPEDFRVMIDDTVWNRSELDKVYGPLNPQEWQNLKSGITGSGVVDSFRIRVRSGQRRFYIDPTPSSVETFSFEYRSNSWVLDSSTTPNTFRTEFTQDSETSLLDEFLLELGAKWRVLNALGQSYHEERDEYDEQVSLAFAEDGAARTIRMSEKSHKLVVAVPDTGYGS